jgi:Peptidase A4 family
MIPTPPDDSFEMVFGQWVVPTVLPKNPSGEELSLAFWVGLAGSVPNIGGQLLQGGCLGDS